MIGCCSVLQVGGECGAGSPPRRAGNFLLRGQKKVTKEEALNRTRAPHARTASCNSRSAAAQTRTAALSLLSLSPERLIAAADRLTRGCTPCSREMQMQCRSGDAVSVFPGEPGVQPALIGMKVRSVALFIGTAARAQRFASARSEGACFRAPQTAASRWLAVERLFFGDFLLAPQKKVTPPPGGTPGTVPLGKCHVDTPNARKAGRQQATE